MYASPWIADTFVLIDDDRILDAILRCVPIVLEVLSAFPESDALNFVRPIPGACAPRIPRDQAFHRGSLRDMTGYE